MRTLLASGLLLFLLHQPAPAGESLPRSTPEAQGVASSAILDFVRTADKQIDSLHSVMIVRHGQVIAEGWWSPYSAGSPHALYSLSKSFTSTAVGLAIAEKKLSLSDPVLKFFPEDAPASPSAHLKAMRVSDLLRMSTGHQVEPKRPDDAVWTKVFLAAEVPHKPGTHFLYNTSGTYMLSAIVQKATGQTVLDYLRPRLFEPLGIENPTWGTSPQGISQGGYGLSIRTEDIARFGQLYLQKGMWNGKRLVPESWVNAATSRQTSNGSNPNSDWEQGYGYQFWRARHGAYRGDGAFGQFCVVIPNKDAVIAITSGTRDMQAVLNLVWAKLLPAMKPEALSPDAEAHEQLTKALAALTIPTPKGDGKPSPSKTYTFPSNPIKLESIRLETDKGTTLVARVDGKEYRVECGSDEWKKGRFALGPMFPEQPVAAVEAVTTDGTFTAKICFYETPFIVTMRLKFEGDKLVLDAESNVGFGRTRMPQLVGKAE